MHKFMFLKAIKITMSRTNAKTPLKIHFFRIATKTVDCGKKQQGKKETSHS